MPLGVSSVKSFGESDLGFVPKIDEAKDYIMQSSKAAIEALSADFGALFSGGRGESAKVSK